MSDKPGVRVAVRLEAADRRLLNACQGGFPIARRPFRDLGERLGLSEEEVLHRLRRLLAERKLSRFGPVINPRRLGGESSLVAMAVPRERLDEVINVVNGFPQVSHNYEREHAVMNMWFVVSAGTPGEVAEVLQHIAAATGLQTYNCPMIEEYWIGLKFALEADMTAPAAGVGG